MKFKEPASELSQYLGARHKLTELDPKDLKKVRRLDVDMNQYVLNAVAKFEAEYGKALPKVTSPYLSDAEWKVEGGFASTQFSRTCASHVATLLFLGRVARPDIAVARAGEEWPKANGLNESE